jgi:N-acetylmuramoyl-L-alanine amidase
VQRALYGALASQNTGIRDRGVREASFVVLTGTEMPSILAEISFVSSPADEERLQNAAYRQQIAEALFKGIERFATTSHRVKMASNSGPSAGQ